MSLKVSVLSNGSILLDGMPVALSNLKAALEQADKTTGRVLYYRENAGAEPPPQSKEVMDLVIANRLPISLSSKPDFSDYVDRFGQLHSRPDASAAPRDRAAPHMPDVNVSASAGDAFAKARAQASGQNGSRGIAIVRPDRAVLFLTLPPPPPQTSLMAKHLASVIPSDHGQNVAVIAFTAFTMTRPEAARIQEASAAIPFFGLLCGLNYVGHRILIFEGHPSALALGLEQSEVLIVDSAMLPFLQPDWMPVAQRVMPANRRIFIHDRKAGRLLPATPSPRPPGWRLSEPDGEASYANCLLTTLGKGPGASAEIGTTVPNLASLTSDPAELEWIAGLPFRYESLNPQKVIDVLLTTAGRSKLNSFKKEWTVRTKLVTKDAEPKLITFELRLESEESNPALVIRKL